MKAPELKLENAEAAAHLDAITSRYPHVGENIRWMWGSAMLDEYVFNIMNDTRDGKRKGFDWDILMSINSLQRYHQEIHPHLVQSDSDPWNHYHQYRL